MELILVVAVGAVAIIVITVILLVLSKKTWDVSYNGHRITLENRVGGEKLYIDGALVDQRTGMAIASDLRGQIRNEDGSASIVVGKIRSGMFGTTIRGHVFVDDKMVGGDPV